VTKIFAVGKMLAYREKKYSYTHSQTRHLI